MVCILFILFQKYGILKQITNYFNILKRYACHHLPHSLHPSALVFSKMLILGPLPYIKRIASLPQKLPVRSPCIVHKQLSFSCPLHFFLNTAIPCVARILTPFCTLLGHLY